MTALFVALWTVMIFLSIVWYGFLIFYVGVKGGKEIGALARTLDEREATDSNDE